MSTKSTKWKGVGDEMWKGAERISGELFTLTYGAFVASIFRECDQNGLAANKKLEKMGYNIGVRMIDDFISHLPAGAPIPGRCIDLVEAAEIISKAAFRYYLNISPPTVLFPPDSDGRQFTLSFPSVVLKPGGEEKVSTNQLFGETFAATASSLASSAAGALSSVMSQSQQFGEGLGSDMVELPESAIQTGFHYANMLCGVIRGALEMVQLEVECEITADPLLDSALGVTEMSVKLVRHLDDESPPEE